MSIKDYDRIIRLIEKDITRRNPDLARMVMTMLTLSRREVNDVLKFIDPERRCLNEYILERKIHHALEDYAGGMTQAEIAEKYNYSDMTHFGQTVKNLCGGKTVAEHKRDGYTCPEPSYLKDILEEASSEAESSYIREMIGFVDEISRLKDELSREKAKKEVKKMGQTAAVKEDAISVDRYYEFLKIEDLRASYGFDVETMLSLHSESISSGIPLEDLCDRNLEKKYYTGNWTSYDDETESLAYHVLYEGDSMQNWAYFAGDDEVDDRECMREENMYSDVEVFTNFEDICQEAHDEGAFEEDEEDPTPTDEQLKEWFDIDPPEPGGDTYA